MKAGEFTTTMAAPMFAMANPMAAIYTGGQALSYLTTEQSMFSNASDAAFLDSGLVQDRNLYDAAQPYGAMAYEATETAALMAGTFGTAGLTMATTRTLTTRLLRKTVSRTLTRGGQRTLLRTLNRLKGAQIPQRLMFGMQKVPGVMGQGLRKTAELFGKGFQKMKMGQMLANGMIDGTKSVAIEQIVRKDLPLWSKQSAVTFGFGFATGMWGPHLESAPVMGMISMFGNLTGQMATRRYVDENHEFSPAQLLLTGALSTGSAATERYILERSAGLSKPMRIWGAKFANGVPWFGIELSAWGLLENKNGNL